jgi:hypothetical protein
MKKVISAVRILGIMALLSISLAADQLAPNLPLPNKFKDTQIVQLSPSVPKGADDLLLESGAARSGKIKFVRAPIRTVQNSGNVMIKTASKLYWLSTWHLYEAVPAQFVFVNVTDRQLVGVYTHQGPETGGGVGSSAILHSNGKLYFSVEKNNIGCVDEFDFATHTLTYRGPMALRYSPYSVCESPVDHKIYWGTTPYLKIFSYNPATPLTPPVDLGCPDSSATPGSFIYSLGATPDGLYLIMSIRDRGNYWLVRQALTDSTKKVYWKGEGYVVRICKDKKGNPFVVRNDSKGESYYRFVHGEPQAIPYPGELSSPVEIWNRKKFGFETSFGNIPSNFIPYLELLIRRLGTVAWEPPILATGITLDNCTVSHMIDAGDTTIMLPSQYTPVIEYNVATNQVINYHGGTGSHYNGLRLADGRIVGGDYFDATWIWDRTKPWTVSTKKATSTPNPKFVRTGGTYPYYLAQGASGMLYVGVHVESGRGGPVGYGPYGLFCWVNPDDLSNKGYIVNRNVEGKASCLVPINGGHQIVYVTKNNNPPTLYIYNDADHKLAKTITPSGTQALDKAVEYPAGSGVIVGVRYPDPKAGTTGIFRLNTATEAITEVTFNGLIFDGLDQVRRDLILGPESCIWFTAHVGANFYLYKMDPFTLATTQVGKLKKCYRLFFKAGKLYLY